MTFDFSTLKPDDSQANRLANIDALVDQGVSRPQAERLANAVFDLIDGPFTQLLEAGNRLDGFTLTEACFIRAGVVAYLIGWAEDRADLVALQQILCLQALTKGNPRHG